MLPRAKAIPTGWEQALSPCRHASQVVKPSKLAPKVTAGPPMSSISYLPSPSNQVPQTATPSSPPDASDLKKAAALFLPLNSKAKPWSRFLYSAPRFFTIPRNARIPEVCILGRSNVGKSTLLNALAGAAGVIARRAHGVEATKSGLAKTSGKAGCTTTMNAYGFGPPMRQPATAEANSEQDKTDSGGHRSRSRRRAAPKEPPPRHSLIVMDMPGYGKASRDEWGVEIAKYLRGRAMLRGAILLVDAVVGIKDGDKQALAMLRSAGVKTQVVLTKADKLLASLGEEKGEGMIRKTCLQVWETLRDEETSDLYKSWTEGHGWEREICTTGAGDPKSGGMGVAGARLAICRLAGIIQKEGEDVPALKADPTGKTVPFDQIQWSETSSSIPAGQIEGEQPPRRGRIRPWRRNLDWNDLVASQHRSRPTQSRGRATF